MLFRKKDKINKEELAKNKAEQLDAAKRAAFNNTTKISVMPDKFWIKEEVKKSFWTMRKIWSAVVLSMIVLIGGIYALLWSTSQNSPASSTTPPPVSNENQIANDDNAVVDDVVAPPSEESAPEAPAVQTAPATISLDQDGDGLTDVEENLYGTDVQLTDTDGDGYVDSSELIAGFNPVGSGRALDNAILSTYQNVPGNYSLVYPSAWQQRGAGNTGVQFATGSGEIVIVALENNPANLPLLEWYSAATAEPIANVTTKTIGNIVGAVTPDGRGFYFVLPDRPEVIFSVNHTLSNKQTIDFGLTVEIIIASIKSL